MLPGIAKGSRIKGFEKNSLSSLVYYAVTMCNQSLIGGKQIYFYIQILERLPKPGVNKSLKKMDKNGPNL